MKYKTARNLFISGLFAAVTLPSGYGIYRFAGRNAAYQELPSTINDVPGKTKSSRVRIDLLAKIDEARQALTRTQAGFKVCDGNRICGYHTVLAVTHGEVGAIEFIYVSAEGDASNGYQVEWSRRNGVNTDFHVTYPEGYVVLALRRGLNVEGDEYREIIYTPYTREIDAPEVRERGRRYLTDVVSQAHALARSRNIPSKARKGEMVADRVPLNVAVTLALIEHLEPERVIRKDADQAINELFTVIGANTRVAYNYSTSRAGARGLFQFMPGTYAEMKKRYPDAKLNEYFGEGMRDHVNAALAAFLLFDSDLDLLSEDELGKLSRDPVKLGEYLAAAYNGGGPDAKSGKLKKETKQYVEKFTIVYQKLFAQ